MLADHADSQRGPCRALPRDLEGFTSPGGRRMMKRGASCPPVRTDPITHSYTEDKTEPMRQRPLDYIQLLERTRPLRRCRYDAPHTVGSWSHEHSPRPYEEGRDFDASGSLRLVQTKSSPRLGHSGGAGAAPTSLVGGRWQLVMADPNAGAEKGAHTPSTPGTPQTLKDLTRPAASTGDPPPEPAKLFKSPPRAANRHLAVTTGRWRLLE